MGIITHKYPLYIYIYRAYIVISHDGVHWDRGTSLPNSPDINMEMAFYPSKPRVEDGLLSLQVGVESHIAHIFQWLFLVPLKGGR